MLDEVRYVLGDRHYNTPDLQDLCAEDERELVTTRYGRYPQRVLALTRCLSFCSRSYLTCCLPATIPVVAIMWPCASGTGKLVLVCAGVRP